MDSVSRLVADVVVAIAVALEQALDSVPHLVADVVVAIAVALEQALDSVPHLVADVVVAFAVAAALCGNLFQETNFLMRLCLVICP